MIVDEQNLDKPVKIETHPSFSNNKSRQAEIVFTPDSSNLIHSNYILFEGHLRYVYGRFKGWVTNEKGTKIAFSDVVGILEITRLKW